MRLPTENANLGLRQRHKLSSTLNDSAKVMSHSETIAVVSKRRGNQKGKLQTQAASKFGYERRRTKRRRSATLPSEPPQL
jgi:hypothetical protein